MKPSSVVNAAQTLALRFRQSVALQNFRRNKPAAVVLIAVPAAIALIFLALALLGSPPIGKEVARHEYMGNTYVFVKYEDDLAIFTEFGSPVNDKGLASDVLSSYAWKLELADFDTDALAAAARRVEAINDRVSSVRDFSNNVVAIFDGIDSVGVDIPLLGRLSALDVLSEALSGVEEVEYVIHGMDDELNDLDDNSGTLAAAAERILHIDPWDISGEEMDELFVEASEAAYDLASSSRSVRDKVDKVRSIIDNFTDSGSWLDRFSSQLADFEYDLGSLGARMRDAQESATQAHKEYTDRWMKKPHDAEWPPKDPKRRTDSSD